MEGLPPPSPKLDVVSQDNNSTNQAQETTMNLHEISLNPICSLCGTRESFLWATDSNKKIICRSCSKVILPTTNVVNGSKADELDKNVSSKGGETTSINGTENEAPGPSGPKKVSRRGKMKQGSCQSKQSSIKGKGRRSIFKKCVYKSPVSVIMPVTSDTIFYRGVLYQAGDIVSVTDFDGSIYYSQIRGFLQDQYCEKSAALTWLIPTQQSHRNHFDPATYILGPEEDIPRKLECLTFVCNCPSDYFKLKHSLTSSKNVNRATAFTWTHNGPSLVRLEDS